MPGNLVVKYHVYDFVFLKYSTAGSQSYQSVLLWLDNTEPLILKSSLNVINPSVLDHKITEAHFMDEKLQLHSKRNRR